MFVIDTFHQLPGLPSWALIIIILVIIGLIILVTDSGCYCYLSYKTKNNEGEYTTLH